MTVVPGPAGDARAPRDAPAGPPAPRGAPDDGPGPGAAPEARPALTDVPAADYEAALADVPGLLPFNARQVRRWVLQRGVTDVDAMTDLSKALRAALAERFVVRRGRLERVHRSADGTLGLVTRLRDGRLIESVRIPDGQRATLCLSSQVGCAVACRFCASGLEGVERNLTHGEIVEQVLVAREAEPDAPLTNYVFMGSGEPTHNLGAVLSAIGTMQAPEGLGIGARRITVSTIGHPPALERLCASPIPFGIALSVHAPTDAARRALMPGLPGSDLRATLAAAQARFDATGRRITVEVVVMAGVNDRDEDARALAGLVAGRNVVVNLIPWNPVEGIDLRPPKPARVEAMAALLRGAGVTTTVRRPRGQDVGVACGQLRRRAARG